MKSSGGSGFSLQPSDHMVYASSEIINSKIRVLILIHFSTPSSKL